jgi:hypothetical protein
MSFDLTVKKGTTAPASSNPVDAKRVAMAAVKAKAHAETGKEPAAAIIKYIPPGECPDRIRAVFDDSGSMYSEIEHAKQGVVEFLRNCVPNQTSVAVHWMNTKPAIELQSDLVKLGNDVLERQLSSGDTPFFNTLKQALEAKPTLTRLVAFTDGSPTDALDPETGTEIQESWSSKDNWIVSAEVIIKIAHMIGDQSLTNGYVSNVSGKEGPCIPIDTVFFGGSYNTREIELLKYLSSNTGGYFLHFDPSKPNIWKQLKYLAPVNRLMLASASFRAEVEKGGK